MCNRRVNNKFYFLQSRIKSIEFDLLKKKKKNFQARVQSLPIKVNFILQGLLNISLPPIFRSYCTLLFCAGFIS
ncbi:hypothetical protein C1646_717733 [Rhizophagus diaphanus]|nr:hypothetical protein C1646_717733 [Rhizophagus diaphanus] [Rhizophagus sp. MUCL 43196]